MNNGQQQIIDEAYSNYKKNAVVGDVIDSHYEPARDKWNLYNKEEFINFIKKNDKFSEKWGLKIDERELNRKERGDHYYKHGNSEGLIEGSLDRPIWETDETAHKWYDERNVPTQLITVIYNNETIESYD